jgi:hypothetical protein
VILTLKPRTAVPLTRSIVIGTVRHESANEIGRAPRPARTIAGSLKFAAIVCGAPTPVNV